MTPSRQRRRKRRRTPIREEVWNLPNILTYGRVAAVPLVMWLLVQVDIGTDPHSADPTGRLYSFWAAIVFAAAALTDFLDGWVARNWNLGSTLGRFLDPLADKLIVMASLVMLVYLQRCPAWLAVLLIAREISITSLRAIATAEGFEIRVSWGGKWKTAFQLCGLLGLLAHYVYPVSWGIAALQFDFHKIGLWLLLISLFYSLQSGVGYFRGFVVSAAAQRPE